MLYDILRVLLEKILISAFMKKLENDSSTANPYDNKGVGRQSTRYCIRPVVAKVYEKILPIVCPLFRIFTITSTLLLIAGGCYLRFVDDSFLPLSDLTGEDRIAFITVVVNFLVVIWGLDGSLTYLYRYMKNTRYDFKQDKIYKQTADKKVIVIEYEDFKKYMIKKKIRIRNGRLEFPYANGIIPVYTWGDDAAPSSFFHFISMRCGINLPRMDKPEAEMVRKIGLGWSLSTVMALPLFGISLWGSFLATICDFGINHGLKEMVRYFLDYFFSIFNVFGIMGAICVVIGWGVKIRNYFPAKKHFARYKDIIKVSFF